MFSGMAKLSATIFVGAFEARLEIYYSTFWILRYCHKPSRKQLVVTIGCLSFIKRNKQLQGGNPLQYLVHRHRTMTPCRCKLIELTPRHSPRVNRGIAEPIDYVYIVVDPPISFVFSQSRIINDKYLQTIRQDGPNNGKTTVSNYSRSHVVGESAFVSVENQGQHCRCYPRGCVEVGQDHGGLVPRNQESEEGGF